MKTVFNSSKEASDYEYTVGQLVILLLDDEVHRGIVKSIHGDMLTLMPNSLILGSVYAEKAIIRGVE